MKKSIIFIFVILQGVILLAENTLKIGQYQVSPNTEFVVQLVAENTDPFVAFQVDIPVPDGFKYIDNSAELNASRISGHALSASLVTGNILRLIGYSVGNTAFLGNSGTLVSFSLKSGGVPATFELILNQPLLGDSQSTNILSGSSNGSVTVLAPNIVLSTSTLEYGRVPLGSSAEQSFQITNTGSIDLTITSLNFNDTQFSTTEVSGFSIAPQTSRTITVRFSPTAKGTLSKQLLIGSNDPDQASSNLTLNGVGFAVNEIHTGSISGASSTTKTLEFTLNNMEALTGFQFDLNLPQALTYQVGTAELFRSQDQIVSVNQVNSQTLRIVAFSVGNKNFTGTSGKVLSLDFLLYGNAGSYSIGINNVIIANATGENIVSDSFGGQLNVTCPSLYSNSQLSFGDVSILSSSTLLQRVYNYGQEPLTINKLQFSNTYFKSNQTLPVTVQPNNYVDLPVIFTDSVKSTANGTVKIFSNDPNNNPFVVQLNGNAFIPNYLKINPPNYVPGESKNVAIEVQNEEAFVAMQFDLSYPIGFTPDLNAITLTNRKQDQILAAIALSNTSLRILVYSPGQKTFTGKSGSVLNIPFKAESSLMYGTYNLNLSNAMISNTKSENILNGTKNGILNVQITTNTQKITNNSTIKLYPNPTTESFYISGINGNIILKITNVNGKVLLTKQVTDNEKVSMKNMPEGLYILEIINLDSTFERKLIKK